MKRILSFAALCVALSSPSWLTAQASPQASPGAGSSTLNHAEIGIYGDYFRFAPNSAYHANFLGVGGRVGFNMNPFVALEGEMNYDFSQDFTTTNSSGTTTTVVTTSVRPLTGLFGPKLQFGGGGPFRVFATGKVGFIDFSTNYSGVVSGSTFTGAVAGVGNAGTHLAFYPGGGIEAFAGPIGIRAEAGDEIYLNGGTYNNLRITFGPTIRF